MPTKLGLMDVEDGLVQVVDIVPPGSVPTSSSSGTFQLTWPVEDHPPHSVPSAPPSGGVYHQPTTPPAISPPYVDSQLASLSEQEYTSDSPTTPTVEIVNGTKPRPSPSETPPHLPPRLSRAFSSPLPSQLRHLRHPSISREVAPAVIVSHSTPLPPPTTAAVTAHVQELAMELADSVQMVIQTLIQISPPHLLDPVKEQYSACTLQLPTPSVSALLTTMKNLNYMSANLPALSSPYSDSPPEKSAEYSSAERLILEADGLVALEEDRDTEQIMATSPANLVMDDFDIGEVMQSVGDVLSGIAASAGVDLVLYHADVGMKHVTVKGDECGISYALCHVVRQVISVARVGDTIELGLLIMASSSPKLALREAVVTPEDDTCSPSVHSGAEGPLLCTFEITHQFGSADNGLRTEAELPPRQLPQFSTAILQRLLRHVRATLQQDTQKNILTQRSVELSAMLYTGSPPSVITEPDDRQPFPTISLPKEPTLEELAAFIATDTEDGSGLKGQKAVFHACQRSSFAHHLTSYLTAWGLDVLHMPTDGEVVSGEARQEGVSSLQEEPGQDASISAGMGNTVLPEAFNNLASNYSTTISPIPEGMETSLEEPEGPALPLTRTTSMHRYGSTMSDLCDATFIIIDDDVNTLRRRLRQIRSEALVRYQSQAALYIQHPKKRPSLAAHHRPRSSPHVRLHPNLAQHQMSSSPQTQPVVIHFTSLANYKVVKDTIQTTLYSQGSTPLSTPTIGGQSSSPLIGTPGLMTMMIPEVLVIPKPAGPRRFLTALHTAIRKPYVDPLFNPIATSPMSPGGTWAPNPLGYPSPWAIGGNGRSNSNVSGTSSNNRQDSNNSLPSGASPSGRPGSNDRRTSPLQDHTPLLNANHLRTHPHPHPPSPQARESLEYFSETASKLGDHAAASAGMLLHSPDGRPAGIYFQPRQASLRMEYFGRNAAATNGSISVPSGSPDGREHGRRGSMNAGDGGSTPRPASASMSFSESQSFEGSAGLSPVVTPSVPLSPPAAPRPPRPTSSGRGQSGSQQGALPRKTSLSVASDDPGRPAFSRILPNSSQSKISPRRAGTIASPADLPYNSAIKSPGLSPIVDPTGARGFPPRRPSSLVPSVDGILVRKASPLQLSALGNIAAPTSPSRVSPGAKKANQVERALNEKPATPTVLKKGKVDITIMPSISVLIVEDNIINQTILTTFMKRRKIHYGTAKNGQEAVDQWKTGQYHLILMDIQMPVKDGIDATKEIRALEKQQNIGFYPPTPPGDFPRPMDMKNGPIPGSPFRSSVIIVALTASALKSDRVTALAAGCNDFLTKPVSLTWLNSKIIEWGSIKMLQQYMDPAFLAQERRTKAVASHLRLPHSRNSSPGSSVHASPVPRAQPPPPHPLPERPTINVQQPSSNSDVPVLSSTSVPPAIEQTLAAVTTVPPPPSPPPSAEVSPGSDAPKQEPQPQVDANHPEEEHRNVSPVAATRPATLRSRARSSLGSISLDSVLHSTTPVGERSSAQEPDPIPGTMDVQPTVIAAPPTPSLSLTEMAHCIVTGTSGAGYFDSKGLVHSPVRTPSDASIHPPERQTEPITP